MACRSSVTSDVSVVVSTAEVRAVTVTSSATVAGASVKLTVRRAPTVIVTLSSLPAAKPGNSARMSYPPGGSRRTLYVPMGPDTAAPGHSIIQIDDGHGGAGQDAAGSVFEQACDLGGSRSVLGQRRQREQGNGHQGETCVQAKHGTS